MSQSSRNRIWQIAAEKYARRDWHQLTAEEKADVVFLEKHGLIIPNQPANGFVGKVAKFEDGESIQKWEYKTERIGVNLTMTPERLKELGDAGWELCSVESNPTISGNVHVQTYYFKRPL